MGSNPTSPVGFLIFDILNLRHLRRKAVIKGASNAPGWFMSSMYKICTDINVLAKTMSLSISNEPILNEEKIALPARWTIGPLSQWLGVQVPEGPLRVLAAEFSLTAL